MSNLENTARAEMVIRKPIDDVFNAFIDPAVTTNFWFTKSTGRLEKGARVDWIWEMYNLTVPVFVKDLEKNLSVTILWGTGEHESEANFSFESIDENRTFVKIKNYNFKGNDQEVVSKVIDSTGGFSLVLAGLKSWLEHGINLRLIGDKVPSN